MAKKAKRIIKRGIHKSNIKIPQTPKKVYRGGLHKKCPRCGLSNTVVTTTRFFDKYQYRMQYRKCRNVVCRFSFKVMLD